MDMIPAPQIPEFAFNFNGPEVGKLEMVHQGADGPCNFIGK
ncbi:hypothetical protein CCACVL1_11013 [Corchorus capsularis]|uniref:Uncharacterized protein n=1 Tax=Corchorus capsularis TaxID=210143 RepID=A0A1R3INB6_COCAP|nr:hypothetical protein CCACVL1_11013 [Corchorus capsularis]